MLCCCLEQENILLLSPRTVEKPNGPQAEHPSKVTAQTGNHMERDFSEVPKEGICWFLLPSELPQQTRSLAPQPPPSTPEVAKEHQNQLGRRDHEHMWWVVIMGGRGEKTTVGKGGASAPSKADPVALGMGWPLLAMRTWKQRWPQEMGGS